MPLLRFCALLPALLTFGLLGSSAGTAYAGWPTDPFSGNVRLSNANFIQVYPRLAADGSGGAFIAWHDFRNGNYDIYIQRVASSGALLWGAAAIPVCTATGDQANTALVSDGAGGVIVAWHDFRAGNWDIYAQRFDASGTPQWTADGVPICTAANQQNDPQIVTDGAGGAILAWPDYRSGIRDIYAQRVDAAGALQWAANGVGVCTFGGDQAFPVIAVDGVGGAIIAWRDQRVDAGDIYAQRLNASGTAQWTVNGVQVAVLAAAQHNVQIIPDGYSGAILCWEDFRNTLSDIFAERISPNGTSLWGIEDGTPVSVSSEAQFYPNLCSDGVSGAIITWLDTRSGGGGASVYAQRMSGAGSAMWTLNGTEVRLGTIQSFVPSIVPDGVGGAVVGWVHQTGSYRDISANRINSTGITQWGVLGTMVSGAFEDQEFPNGVPDGNGGMILTWHDYRTDPVVPYVYAQRVDRYGLLGSAEPAITSVRDTPNDQGGQVKVSWSRSYLDDGPNYAVTTYRIWRSVPSAPFASLRAAGRTTRDPEEAATSGRLLVLPESNDYAWELIDSQAAAGLPAYSLVVPTSGDSVAGSNPQTAFMVEARYDASATSPRWFSAPDSGYSVDNLPPGAPGPFTGTYSAGTVDLHWTTSPEPDFWTYRLYRGVDPGFTPVPGALVAAITDPAYVDVANQPYTYKVSSVDIHGNEGPYATLSFGETTDAPTIGRPRVLALAEAQPNPARSATRIAYELPEAGNVTLSVIDVGGRIVRVLEQGAFAAGRRELRWDLRDAGGSPVSSGVYFVRLDAGGTTRTRRMVAMR